MKRSFGEDRGRGTRHAKAGWVGQAGRELGVTGLEEIEKAAFAFPTKLRPASVRSEMNWELSSLPDTSETSREKKGNNNKKRLLDGQTT